MGCSDKPFANRASGLVRTVASDGFVAGNPPDGRNGTLALVCIHDKSIVDAHPMRAVTRRHNVLHGLCSRPNLFDVEEDAPQKGPETSSNALQPSTKSGSSLYTEACVLYGNETQIQHIELEIALRDRHTVKPLLSLMNSSLQACARSPSSGGMGPRKVR